MKIALVSLINSKFVIAYKAFIKSFLLHNDWFKHDLILLNDRLTNADKVRCRAYYRNTSFRDIDYDRYKDVNWDNTKDRLKSTYYKLDIFSLYAYDRIIFIDLDTIVLNDIRKLFTEYKGGICAALGYNRGSDRLRNDINSGVLVLNKAVLNKKTYTDVIKLSLRGHGLPDQHVINQYFKNKIEIIDKTFNIEKRMYFSRKFDYSIDKGNIAILHYVGPKPWENIKESDDYFTIEKVWWVFNNMLWNY